MLLFVWIYPYLKTIFGKSTEIHSQSVNFKAAIFLTEDEDDELGEGEEKAAPTFLGSPLTDGTIEEDFQAALSRDMAKDSLNSGLSLGGGSSSIGHGVGIREQENFSDIARSVHYLNSIQLPFHIK